MLENEVTAWVANVWREDSSAQSAAGHTLLHCQDPVAYTSVGDGLFSYKPTFCQELPNEEAHFTNQNKLFLASFIDDTLVWDGTGERCGAASKQACLQNADAVFEEADADGRCFCKFHEQFNVKKCRRAACPICVWL
jgi:hypothetical protein